MQSNLAGSMLGISAGALRNRDLFEIGIKTEENRNRISNTIRYMNH